MCGECPNVGGKSKIPKKERLLNDSKNSLLNIPWIWPLAFNKSAPRVPKRKNYLLRSLRSLRILAMLYEKREFPEESRLQPDKLRRNDKLQLHAAKIQKNYRSNSKSIGISVLVLQ